MLTALLLLIAALLTGFNWLFFAMNRYRHQRGLPGSVSTVPLVVQILVIMAAISSTRGSSTHFFLAWQTFWLIGLADIALYQLLQGLWHRARHP